MQERLIEGDTIICRTAAGQRNVPYRLAATWYFVEQEPAQRLFEAISSVKTDAELRLETASATLRKFGFKVSIQNAPDLLALARVVEQTEHGAIPDRLDRDYTFDLLKKHNAFFPGVKLTNKWRSIAYEQNQTLIPDVFIKNVYFLRHTKQLERAREASDVVELPREAFPANPGQTAVLSTERAAVFLDLFERDGDPALLRAARICANRAYAIHQSEEVRMVHKRISKLEAEYDEQQAEHERLERLRRVGDPNRLR